MGQFVQLIYAYMLITKIEKPDKMIMLKHAFTVLTKLIYPCM